MEQHHELHPTFTSSRFAYTFESRRYFRRLRIYPTRQSNHQI